MVLNYNHLYYFHVAAVEGSVAGAAQRLGVTQPTVSEQVRTLEQAMEATLFDRTPTGLRLTDTGRLVFLHSLTIFGESERLAKSIAPGSPRDVVRVGLSSALPRSTSHAWLMLLLARPERVVSARTAETVELVRALRSGQLDVVLCELEPTMDLCRGLAMKSIARTRFVVVAPRGVTPTGDWSDVGLARLRPTSPYHAIVAEHLRARKARPRVVVESDDALFLVEAAAERGCVAIVPESAARAAIAAGKVDLVETIQTPSVEVYALYYDRALALGAIDVLVANQDRC